MIPHLQCSSISAILVTGFSSIPGRTRCNNRIFRKYSLSTLCLLYVQKITKNSKILSFVISIDQMDTQSVPRKHFQISEVDFRNFGVDLHDNRDFLHIHWYPLKYVEKLRGLHFASCSLWDGWKLVHTFSKVWNYDQKKSTRLFLQFLEGYHRLFRL